MSEILNEGQAPQENPTKVKIALSAKNGGSKILVDDIKGYKTGYNVDGIAIYNDDNAILMSLSEFQMGYGKDTQDLPESDKRREATCSMTEFDGEQRTDYSIRYFKLKSGAPVEAKKFGWLPASGEIGLIADNREEVNALLEIVGGTPVSEGLYWTSMKFSKEYIWHCDMAGKVLHMYKGMASQLSVRPVKALEGYQEV